METPLASIAQVLAGSAIAPPPVGALEVPASSALPTRTAAAATVAGPQSSPASSGLAADRAGSGPTSSRGERRQPPRPDVVVMPPVAEAAAAKPAPRRRRSMVWLVLLLIGGAVGAAVWLVRPAAGPAIAPSVAPPVHVVVPQPTTFYRWFDTLGVVVPGRGETINFTHAGRILDLLPPGTTFAAGESIGRLQGVTPREAIVNKLRARLAFTEQLRQSASNEGDQAAIHQADAKIAARKQDLVEAQASLAELEIRPKLAGEIAQVLSQKGDLVRPDTPVFRIRATGPRATFPLPPADLARARALAFCRIETVPGSGGVDGGATEPKTRALDCAIPPGGSADDKQAAVDLVGPAVAGPGTQVRLASARYDGVFPVPRAALSTGGGVDYLWIVASGGKNAERRAVEVAAAIDDLVLVAHGIAVGDSVVIDPPIDLKTGAEISVVR